MNGPERSTASEAMTTAVAVITIFSPNPDQNRSSGDTERLFTAEADLYGRPAFDCLIDHAVPPRELAPLIGFFLRRIGLEAEPQPDLREAHRRTLGHAGRLRAN